MYALAVKENYIFAGTESSGVYYSTNNGVNWSETFLNYGSIRCLAIDSTDIYTGETGGIRLSWNNGNSWVGTSVSSSVYSLTVGRGKVLAGVSGPGGVCIRQIMG
ncbi:MAG: WD40/YVTN/BNR-like repeat-containing protein [Ignavibacteria bacterium]